MKGFTLNLDKWKRRDSNIELMRLLCMTMIVIHHMLIGSVYSVPEILESQGSVNFTKGVGILLNSFCYIGVNCFILISGYYSIKFKIRGLIKLYLFCVFYFVFSLLFLDKPIIKDNILHAVFPFSSHHVYWFISCYFVLYLLSPFLNVAIEHLHKKEYVLVLTTLTIANVYYGYIWKQDYNYNGYNVSQMIYLYVISGYIRKYVNLNPLNRTKLFLIYLVFATTLGFLAIISHLINIPFYRTFAYNNPLLILASISFFIFFLRFSFKNAFVNWIASSSLAIYLMPEFPHREFFSSIILQYENIYMGGIILLFLTITYALSKVIIALFFDKIRIYLFEYPLFKFINKVNFKSIYW